MIRALTVVTALLLTATAGCAPAQQADDHAVSVVDAGTQPRSASDPTAARVLQRELNRIAERADSIDAVFQPLPLLRPTDEAALRRFSNDQQLVRARTLGIRPGPTAEQLSALEREGRLVRLEQSTDHWIVRDLDYSVPLVVPAMRSLLIEIAERLQARLAALDVPPYRLELTSVLRSAEDQAALRRVNPNAAADESTHQYATTVDVAYSAFAAPRQPIVQVDAAEAEWLVPYLGRFADAMAETVAARRSRELQAILGHLLIEMQNEGKVMVTLERLQPVYHMTVARE